MRCMPAQSRWVDRELHRHPSGGLASALTNCYVCVLYLFNRRFDLRTILQRLGRAAAQAAPCPLRAVRAAELSC